MGNTILIADDNPADLNLLGGHFSSCGFTVYSAANCKEAIDLAGRHLPDCFVLDYHLGAGDASEICSYIRRNVHIRKNPIVIMSGDPEQAIHSYTVCEADFFIEKGRPSGEVVALLKRQLCRAEWSQGLLKKADVTLDAPNLRILRNSYPPIQLSCEQFRFLSILLENSPEFVKEDDLCTRVFGGISAEKREAVWSLAYRLRQKLGKQLSRRIKNVRNTGWKYVPPRVHANRTNRDLQEV